MQHSHCIAAKYIILLNLYPIHQTTHQRLQNISLVFSLSRQYCNCGANLNFPTAVSRVYVFCIEPYLIARSRSNQYYFVNSLSGFRFLCFVLILNSMKRLMFFVFHKCEKSIVCPKNVLKSTNFLCLFKRKYKVGYSIFNFRSTSWTWDCIIF